jgi:hypothetical protein
VRDQQITTPAVVSQVVTISALRDDTEGTGDGLSTFWVLDGLNRVGEMWRYERPVDHPTWRAYRYRRGISTEVFATQEQAAAAVGWQLRVMARALPGRIARSPQPVRLISPGGDIATLIRAEEDTDRQIVHCTARLDSPHVEEAFHAGGTRAVRSRVADQFGVRCLGGGQRGETGLPVVVFTARAIHRFLLHP